MAVKLYGLCMLLGLAVSVCAAPGFTLGPTLSKDAGNRWWVEFTVSESTDVEVSIVNLRDSAVVRHLAAGVLGAAAPAPFAKGDLHQRIEWDARDDFGRTPASPDSLAARVRAGMQPRLDMLVDRGERGQNSAFTSVLPVFGLAIDSAGDLVAFNMMNTGWPHGPATLSIRAYDGATGDYKRTLFPWPAGLATGSVVPYGAILTGNDGYHLKTLFLPYPGFYAGPLAPKPNLTGTRLGPIIAPATLNNLLVAVNYPVDLNPVPGFMELSGKGECVTSSASSLVRVPAFPALSSLAGPMYLHPFPDNKTLLLSGVYAMAGAMPSDTGFWRDGRVYRVDPVTGAAAVLISLPSDSLPRTDSLRRAAIGPLFGRIEVMSAFHGIAADPAGHIFVCDRFHGRIGIYDTSGAFLKGIPVKDPDQVGVNGATGEVYVTTRNFLAAPTPWVTASVRLIKFSDWRGTPAEAAATTFSATFNADTRYIGIQQTRASMAVSFKAASPVVWWAGGNRHVTGYRDDGSAFALHRNFADSSSLGLFNFDRIAVDPRKEQVYLQNGWDQIYKIESFANPVIVSCTTSTGKRMQAGDMAVSPDGFLYARSAYGGTMNGGWGGPVLRWTTDHRHRQANFAGRDTNKIYQYIGKYGAGFADRGFDISTQGKFAVMDKHSGRWVQLADTTGNIIDSYLVYPLPGVNSGGVQFDGRGNLYVGALLRPAGHVKPAGYESDTAYRIAVGSVVKFPAGQRGSVTAEGNPESRTAPGSERVYARAGLAPYSGAHPFSGMMVCICRTPKFDVDPYGRLFIPNAITGKVAVLDNDDNLIARIGEYGNYDAKGPGIPLLFPVGAAVSEDFIYVTDMVNERLVRISMNFSADNLPGFRPHTAAETRAPRPAEPSVFASPNPFNPVSRITFTLPQRIRATLAVFDLSGRLVKTLFAGTRDAGILCVPWDATDASGRPVSAGIYICRLTAGKHAYVCRTVFSK